MKGLFFSTNKKKDDDQVQGIEYESITVGKTVNLQYAIQHYIPPRFPINQGISQLDVTHFEELWNIIFHDTGSTKNSRYGGTTKLTQLFDIFYHKLFQRSAKFRDYFGTNFKERCRILTRQLVFFTTLKLDSNIDQVFADLGILHQKLGISNWQYSIFAEVLLESISHVLGEHADMLRMQSCARVISFCLFKLLEKTLTPKNLKPMEMNIDFGKQDDVSSLRSSVIQKSTISERESSREPSSERATSRGSSSASQRGGTERKSSNPARAGRKLEKLPEAPSIPEAN